MSDLFKMWEQRAWVAILVIWMGFRIFAHDFNIDLLKYDIVTIVLAWIITIIIVWFVGAMFIRFIRWATMGH